MKEPLLKFEQENSEQAEKVPYVDLNISMRLDDDFLRYCICYLLYMKYHMKDITLHKVIMTVRFVCQIRLEGREPDFTSRYKKFKEDNEISEKIEKLLKDIKREIEKNRNIE